MGYTDFLVRLPNSADGAARIIDLFGDLDAYNASPNAATADMKALHRDSQVISKDAAAAIAKILLRLKSRDKNPVGK